MERRKVARGRIGGRDIYIRWRVGEFGKYHSRDIFEVWRQSPTRKVQPFETARLPAYLAMSHPCLLDLALLCAAIVLCSVSKGPVDISLECPHPRPREEPVAKESCQYAPDPPRYLQCKNGHQ